MTLCLITAEGFRHLVGQPP